MAKTDAPAVTISTYKLRWWSSLGPGFVVAATGVGAGDLIAAAVAGNRYGLAVLWVVLAGAVFKWVLNEGVARWQFATGTTIIEGWVERLPSAVSWYFLFYLCLWGFLVAAALSSACGVAASALLPILSVNQWAAIHALAGFVLVLFGRYRAFENVMKFLIAGIFVSVIACALFMRPDASGFIRGLLVPAVPAGSGRFLLGAMGGVGGSVTLLCYGYWIRERGWTGEGMRRRSLLDLTTAYALTGLFGIAVIVLAAGIGSELSGSGTSLVLGLADKLGDFLGPSGRLCFLVGFWCAVFSSLLGVWQGVPYLFADTIQSIARKRGSATAGTSVNTATLGRAPAYRWFLVYMAFPPLLLLVFQRPLAIVVAYAVAGAFFMPFLASVLLIMNNRRDWAGVIRNGWTTNILLVLSLLLFGYLFLTEAWSRVGVFFQ
jgi:Mn2+/Fe2+ NRAMP family transporter